MVRVRTSNRGCIHTTFRIVRPLWCPKQAEDIAAHRRTTVYLDHFQVERSSFSGGLFEYFSLTWMYLIHSSRYLFYQWPSRVSTRRRDGTSNSSFAPTRRREPESANRFILHTDTYSGESAHLFVPCLLLDYRKVWPWPTLLSYAYPCYSDMLIFLKAVEFY